MDPFALLLLLVAPFVGSFLGVVIQRLPTGRPIALARSSCDACGCRLRPRDLVPVLSWLARRGRCRCRKLRLGVFYPAIELAALGVVLWAATVLSGWLLWASALLGWLLLALAVIDARHQLLPDELTLPLIPLGITVAYVLDPSRLPDRLIGIVAGWLAFAAIAWIYRQLREREGLGMGDAKLMAAAGAWLGWQALPSVALIGAGLALAVALIGALAGGRLEATTRIAFGPYLALGLWLVWLYGPLWFG